jgi:predicted amino acid-binding ACT domain protein
MDLSKLTSMMFPVIISAIAWLLTSMSSIQADLINIKSKMPILITEQGVIIDSPQSAEARGKLKDQLKSEIAELHIRVRLLEEHDMQRRGK